MVLLTLIFAGAIVFAIPLVILRLLRKEQRRRSALARLNHDLWRLRELLLTVDPYGRYEKLRFPFDTPFSEASEFPSIWEVERFVSLARVYIERFLPEGANAQTVLVEWERLARRIDQDLFQLRTQTIITGTTPWAIAGFALVWGAGIVVFGAGVFEFAAKARPQATHQLIKVYFATDRSGPPLAGSWWWLLPGIVILAIGLIMNRACRRSGAGLLSRVLKLAARMMLYGGPVILATQLVLRIIFNYPTVGSDFYGVDRSDRLQFGSCVVSVPRSHKSGQLESPSYLKLEFRSDSDKHIILKSATPFPDIASFKESIVRDLDTSRDVLLFIHGYNVSFDDAARRTAQLFVDLQFHGVAMFFSWPSQGGLGKYMIDEANVEWAIPHMKEVLASLLDISRETRIYIIAHSMGNRVLANGLCSLDVATSKEAIREVVLAAPDVDADVYQEQIVPTLTKKVGRVTMYASMSDLALDASNGVHGYARAGDARQIRVVPPVQTIDASAVDTSFLGHGYYGDNRTVIDDLFQVIRSVQPNDRHLWSDRTKDGNEYWVIPK